MPNSKEIKNRIRSIKSTKKITKAMELVAASKMKRAVSKTLASRLYANYSWDLLTSLSDKLDNTLGSQEGINHPFFEKNNGKTTSKTKKTLIVLITSNKGLCGAYNAQIIKKIILKIKELDSISERPSFGKEKIEFITIGKKGDVALRRIGQNIIASFLELPDIISLSDITPLSTLLTNQYKGGDYKSVYIAYTDFISALSQKPQIRQLLPISKKELKEAIDQTSNSAKALLSQEVSPLLVKERAGGGDYLLEGDVENLIESLAEKLVRMQIYQMILESNASEQSLRMVSMKNAGDAAGEMIEDLTLVFNKARQANITREISEISAGMAGVN